MTTACPVHCCQVGASAHIARQDACGRSRHRPGCQAKGVAYSLSARRFARLPWSVPRKTLPHPCCGHLTPSALEIFISLAPTTPANTRPVDDDLAEQAHPGHSIPSQKPAAAAQVRLEPEEAEREAKSVLRGGGVVAGMATGAAVGVVLAGPVGGVVVGMLGAVVGACGAAAAGTLVDADDTATPTKLPAI